MARKHELECVICGGTYLEDVWRYGTRTGTCSPHCLAVYERLKVDDRTVDNAMKMPLGEVPEGESVVMPGVRGIGVVMEQRGSTLVRYGTRFMEWSSKVVVMALWAPEEPEPVETWEVRGAPYHGLQGWVSSEGRTALLPLGEKPDGETIYEHRRSA